MNLKHSTYRDRGNSRDPCSQLSRSVAIIVPQHTTESLAAFDVADNLAHFVIRFDELIVEPCPGPATLTYTVGQRIWREIENSKRVD